MEAVYNGVQLAFSFPFRFEVSCSTILLVYKLERTQSSCKVQPISDVIYTLV